jgi:hypothetical protein
MQRSLKLSGLPQRTDRPATSVAGPVVLRFKRSSERLLMKSAIQEGTRAALVQSRVCQTSGAIADPCCGSAVLPANQCDCENRNGEGIVYRIL